MARKANKAAAILELLNKGVPSGKIVSRLKVAPSYVWKLKKEMAHKTDDDNEVRPRVVAPHKVMRVTKKQAEDIKKLTHELTLGRKGREAAASNGADDLRAMAQDSMDALLAKREDQYGSFMFGANIAIRLKGVMHNAIAQKDLHLAPDQMLALDMIAVKISRILSGNPSHKDSWVDIAGYAKLISDRLEGNVR